MVRDGVLDHFQKLLLRCSRSNGELVEELNHETCESLEGTRDTHSRRYFDEDSFSGVNVDLELASLVDWGVQKGE